MIFIMTLAMFGIQNTGCAVKHVMRKKKKMTLTLLAIFILPASLIMYGCTATPKKQTLNQKGVSQTGPRLTSSDRILVIAPHPDDESLGCAGIIRRAIEKKIPAQVVLMTNGDGYKRAVELHFKTLNPIPAEFKELGVIRRLESIDAMKELGLGKKHIIFLSYPDGGINSLFNQNWDYDNLHRGVNEATYAPCPFAYEKEAPYCGENVVKNLEQIIKDFKPSIILYPDPGDDHHDHWATSAFMEYALAETNYKGKPFTYLVHKGFDWPFPWAYVPKYYLLPPGEMVGLDAKWMQFPLSKHEETLKHKVVNLYVSQRGLMEPFLDAFVRRNELFAHYPDVKVTQVKKVPQFFSGASLPHTIIRDAKKDTLIKELEGFGDITSVGFAFDKNSAWFSLETRRNIANDPIYAFHLRIFGKEGVKRIDIKVQNGSAASEVLAKNSISITESIPIKSKNNRLVIQIPATSFKDADYLLLNADTFYEQEQKRIDRTAWRRVKLE